MNQKLNQADIRFSVIVHLAIIYEAYSGGQIDNGADQGLQNGMTSPIRRQVNFAKSEI